MTRLTRRLLAPWILLLAATGARAYEAGWMQTQVPAASPGAAPTTVALYYPTLATPRTVPMGAFTLEVAIGGQPVDQVKGLILLSHGIGGSELGHSVLAQALARSGYLVAALRHPGDNWQDKSLIEKTPERYFEERPRQASRVIDALLADPAWKARITTDDQGPRVGALGHSAGGYTVLALAGATPDRGLVQQHCRAEGAEDPVFCGLGRPGSATSSAPEGSPSRPGLPTASLRYVRVRAVVAMAPAGAMLTAESLASVRPATLVYEAQLDRFLVPKFHAEWVASHLPEPHLQRVPNAGHFAFMDSPSMPIPSPDGDIGANPPGFERAALLKQLAIDIPAFFDKALR